VLVEGELAGTLVRVLVSDGGPGPRAGWQVGKGTDSPRGHGLAIARDGIEAQGGRLVSRARSAGRALAIELPVADVNARTVRMQVERQAQAALPARDRRAASAA
jgi:hypothetical protein